MPTLRDVVAVLDDLYDPRWADDWDAVGTVAGDPAASVAKVLIAVDPVQAVVDEAIAWGADLLVTHHPLYLKGVTSVAASSPKGKIVHDLISNGIALHTCHTNADSPTLGVSESMALALGLTDVRPLVADPADPVDKWIVFTPADSADKVAAAMHGAGAGKVGAYDSAQFQSTGTGSFRPLEGSKPTIGSVGEVEHVPETRIEMVAERRVRDAVRAAVLDAHPYEEPAYDVLELAARSSDRGHGRIGTLPEPMTLADFAIHVTTRLPNHHSATRVAGDPARSISTVGLCGGSGDFLLTAANAAGADVYVTSDLKHHPVSEHLENAGACAVIDVPHWAAESTWLPVAAAALTARVAGIEARVSQLVTDPWTSHVPGYGVPVKADLAAQAALLDLQATDSSLAQLQHRRKTLPEHAKIEELQARVAELDGTRIEAATAVDDLTRDQRKADAEVELVKTRRARDEERLSSGAISNPKDLASLQHELTALERRITTLEDDELEVMEALEEAQTTLDAAQAELAKIQVELEQNVAARDAAITVIDEQIADTQAERDSSVASVPDDLVTLYDKVRGQYGGLGAAALRAKKCEGCRLEINGADLRELAALPEDEVLRCPECSRILVRTPESGL